MIHIMHYGETPNQEIFARNTRQPAIAADVAAIINDVRANGDEALRRYSAAFDGAAPETLTVIPAELDAAFAAVGAPFLGVLSRAAANIRRFHAQQKRSGFLLNEQPGVVLGQKIMPLDKVGLYIPGGTAAYPSSVLMNAIPAKIAGVGTLVMVSPATDGKMNPAVLAAAKIAGVDQIFKVGGAQAIAALTYGTESVPAVDKIVGPGNAYVAEAKRQVYGQVAIDMIAGPSEILIIADGASNPCHVAADMLSQAEHDKLASAVLLTDSNTLAQAVAESLEIQLNNLPRQAIARTAIEKQGKIIVTDTLQTAITIANEIAPEHLELCVDNPFDYLDRIRHAGSVFLGRNCPEALGDYLAGPNHTLPTGGTARFSSPLSVDDFVKKYQYTYFTADALSAVADDVVAFAAQEGLNAHGRSITVRVSKEEDAQ